MVKRIFVLEASGPTIDIVRKYASQLPTLQQFLNQGAWSRLSGPLQPGLPTSFATLLTGKNPGKTGLFNSFKLPSGGYHRISYSSIPLSADTFYQRLSDAGIEVGLLNVPLTSPLPRIKGFVVSGDEGIGEEYAYPSELNKKLTSFGYFVPFGASYSPGREMSFFKHCMDVLEMQRQALHLLFRDRQWQFGMLTLYALGEIMHAFWKYYDQRHPDFRPFSESFGDVDPFLEGLRTIDRMLSEIIELTGADGLTIMLGAWGHRLEHSKVHLNALLEQKGYLVFKSAITSCIKHLFYRTGLTAAFVEQMLHRLNLYKFIRHRVKSRKGAAFSGSLFLSYQDIDWPRTRAVALGNLGQVYLNDREHRPSGTISKEQYSSERNHLCQLLEDLRDPNTGGQVVERVFTREEIYFGKEVTHAPDLVVKFQEGYSGDGGFSGGGSLVTKSPRNHSSDHCNESVFFALGAGIKPGQVDAGLEDIAPTVLCALDVEVPDDYDGKILPIFA